MRVESLTSIEHSDTARVAIAAGIVGVLATASAYTMKTHEDENSVSKTATIYIDGDVQVLEESPIVQTLPKRSTAQSPTSIQLPPRPVIRDALIKPPPPKPKPRPLPRKPVKAVTQKSPAPKKYIPFGLAAPHVERWVNNLPYLEELQDEFPSIYTPAEVLSIKTHISELNRDIDVTPEEYKAFKLNTKLRNVFRDQANYSDPSKFIMPSLTVLHWTGVSYDGEVGRFIRGIKSRGLRSKYFVSNVIGLAYDLFDSDRRLGATAKGINMASQSIEMEGAKTQDITAIQSESAICILVRDAIARNRPPTKATILGHLGADLLFSNATWDNDEGKFITFKGHKPYMDKFDLPQEYVEMMVGESQKLYNELKAQP